MDSELDYRSCIMGLGNAGWIGAAIFVMNFLVGVFNSEIWFCSAVGFIFYGRLVLLGKGFIFKKICSIFRKKVLF